MEGDWQQMTWNMLMGAAAVLVVASLFTMYYTRRITKPIEQLIEAAEQAEQGNYDYVLDYDQDDEVGRLTSTFRRLASHMKDSISNLNKQVFVDPLTHVKNKGAFSEDIDNLQAQLDENHELEFAIGIFDCDDLKWVNDHYGHDKGDIYLTTASRLICQVFKHSPVYRIGGDEFAVILTNDDYRYRDALVSQFEQDGATLNASTDKRWEQAYVSMGIAVYEPEHESTVVEVVSRADKRMYENKRARKSGR
jgi:diguanylate cyclase (GGDEF)-like protein